MVPAKPRRGNNNQPLLCFGIDGCTLLLDHPFEGDALWIGRQGVGNAADD